MKTKIILLNASAGVGKDFFYNKFKKENENDKVKVVRVAFADAIKGLMTDFLGWDGKNKEGVWRTNMQLIGQYFRDIDKNVWVNYIEDEIRYDIWLYETLKYEQLYVYITDSRFDNEVIRTKELFEYYDVEVVRLHREFESKLSEEQRKDISELGISDELVDVEIYL